MQQKLKKGQTFKNWKDVCEWFDWKNICGTYKQARLKELNCLCEFHKEGNKIVIDKVYKTPKPIEDDRKVGYVDQIEKQTIKMLIDEDNEYHGFNVKTTHYLLRKFGMVNNSFKYGDMRLDKSATYLDAPIEVVEELFKNTKNSNVYIVEKAFNNLAQKKLIQWEKTYSISLQEEVNTNKDINIIYGTKTQVDEYGDTKIVPTREIIVNGEVAINQVSRIATDKEKLIVLNAQKKALDHFGVTDIRGLYKKHISLEEYYTLSEHYIREVIPTFINYWRSYKIIYNVETLKQYVADNKIKFPKKLFFDVNKGVQEQVKKCAKNRTKTAEKRTDDKYDYRLEDEFMGQVDDFNETFISIDSKSVLYKLKAIKPNYKHYKSKKQQFLEDCDELFGND